MLHFFKNTYIIFIFEKKSFEFLEKMSFWINKKKSFFLKLLFSSIFQVVM